MEKKGISRKKFIHLGAVVGAGTACAFATSCNGAPSSAAKASGGVTVNGTRVATEIEPAVKVGDAIADESEVRVDSSVRFTDSETEQPAVLVRLRDGSFVAYSALCTHEKCPVFFQPKDQKIACPCHGAVFNPAKGGVAEVGPAQAPLEEIKVELRNGKVVRAQA